MKRLELAQFPLDGLRLIEASAGTGKTYTIAALYLRHLLERGLPVTQLLGPALGVMLRWPGLLAFVPPMEVMQHPKVITELTGMKMTLGAYIKVGLRSYIIERLYNEREGVGGECDTLPRRYTQQPQTEDHRSVVPLERMLPLYYRNRGLDRRGSPKPATLRRLGVQV